MADIGVNITATANVKQMEAAFARLQGQVAGLNAQLANMVSLQNGVDGKGYERMTKAASVHDKAFKSAVASTGMFEQVQVRVNRATDEYIDKLNKQKMSFRQMMKERKVAASAYREQLAMESMWMSSNARGTATGKNVVDVAIPAQTSKELNTLRKRLAFANAEFRSGATQMVNWGKNTQWAGRQMMVGFTLPIVAAGAAAGAFAYQMDKEFTRIAKVYDTTADAASSSLKDMAAVEQELIELRAQGTKTAMKAAKEYGAAGEETLQVQAALAATGQTGVNLQKNTNEVMRIARLGEVEHQTAIETTIALQSVFRMSTEELTEAFNYMNSVENATSLETADFAAAIPIAASSVKQFGGDVKELGILLTAMKERGIGAVQGANALKASMQRLGRPSKQVRAEWEALTGTDITELFDESTSLLDLFSRIREATRSLTNKEQTKAFAGLFGTYQITRMSALVEGMDDLKDGVGQVSDAYEIAGQDAADWARTADMEMERYQQSISGRWETSIAELKMQMSTLGEPFVVIATSVVKGISNIITKFNELPKAMKTIIALGTGLTAVFGVGTMLLGLTANLIGSSIKGISTIISLVAKMKLATTAQRAAEEQAQRGAQGFVEEASAVEMLTMEIEKQTLAQREATEALRAHLDELSGAKAAGAKRAVPVGGVAGQEIAPSTNRPPEVILTNPAETSGKLQQQATREALARERSERAATGMSAALAVAAATSIAATQVQNKYADLLLKSVTSAALLVASAQAIQKAGLMAYQWGKKRLLDTLKEEASTRRTAGMRAGAAAGRGARGLANSIVALAGRTNLILAGIGAVGYGLYKLHQREAKAFDERIKKQRALNRIADDYAEAVGLARREWDKMPEAQLSNKEKTVRDEAKKHFSESEAGMEQVDYYRELGPSGRNAAALREYLSLLVEYETDTEQAKQALAAFFEVADGSSFESAVIKATNFVSIFGDIGNFNWDKAAAALRAGMEDDIFTFNPGEWDIDEFERVLKGQGKSLGELFNAEFLSASSPEQVANAVEMVSDTAMESWENAFNKLSAMPGKKGDAFARAMKSLGVDSAEGLAQAFYDNRDEVTRAISTALNELGLSGNGDRLAVTILETLSIASATSDEMVTAAAKGADLSDSIENIFQFRGDSKIAAYLTEDLGEAQDAVSKLMNNMLGLDENGNPLQSSWVGINKRAIADRLGFGGLDINSDAQAIDMFLSELPEEEVNRLTVAMNNYARAQNIALGDTPAQTFKNIMNGALNSVGDTAEKTGDKLNAMAGTLKFKSAEVADIYRSSMEDTMNEIADAERKAFDTRADAAIDARQEYWDKRKDSLDNAIDRRKDDLDRRHERESDALDKKWETRHDEAERYWEMRLDKIGAAIDAEQDAEDRRQKMFDAEIARIKRLNDAMNRNIDFNVALNEGNFDEAAKIRNDASAGATSLALERASDKSQERSDKRVEKLEDRLAKLEDRRDDHMDRLKKREEDEKKHLDNIQKMRKDALDDQSDAQKKALDKQAKADMDSQKAKLDYQKKAMEDGLKAFLNIIPRNEKGLRKHIKRVGSQYGLFGDGLMADGEVWGIDLGNSLKDGVRSGAQKLRNSKMWENLGRASIGPLLKSMGFPQGMKQFKHFVKTGKMKNFDNLRPAQTTNKFAHENIGPGGASTRHEGGIIGSGGKNSRKGVARTLKGLHPNEQMIRAQKGEYVVNKKATEKNRGLLEKINSGSPFGYDIDSGGKYGVGGPGDPGPAGFLAAFAATGLIHGTANAMERAARKRREKNARLANTLFTAGKKGVYGDREFSKEQLRNAATIASVGRSMGMSDRDLKIGIMTAIAESGLVNVNHGHLDSLGLFQQRPSMGWGTPQQVTDPEYAARKFFQGLKAISDRDSMPPWMAAQRVQRSAFADGSNYRVRWGEARAIFNRGLERSANGFDLGLEFMQGRGGKHRPVKTGKIHPRGLHPNNGLDIGVPTGTPVYAASDGIVSDSYDIRGFEPRKPGPQDGYRSYGRVIKISHGAFDTLYAHLSHRFAQKGQKVRGGAKIGLAGSTGNSTGPHLHFEAHGRSPYAFLKEGGTVKNDNTPAILHKDERVLTAPLTKKLDTVVDSMYRAAVGGPKTKPSDAGAVMGPLHKNPYGKFKYRAPVMSRADYPYTWFDSEFVKQRAAEKAERGQNHGHKVKSGTYNVLNSTSLKKSRDDLNYLMGQTDILSLQELGPKKRNVLPWLRKQGWGTYAPHIGTGLAWNKDAYKASKMGSKKLANYPIAHNHAVYGRFSPKNGGNPFWQVSAHTIWKKGAAPKTQKRVKMEQYQSLADLNKRLSRGGAPVIMGGDFNLSGTPLTQLEKILGMKSNQRKGIDHLFFNDAVKGGKVRTKRLNSDHLAQMSTFNIPGLAKGAENIRWDNTIANLHRNETVLTEDLSEKFKRGVDNFANGGDTTYYVDVNVANTNASADEIADKVVRKLKREEMRKPQGRRG